MAIIGHSVSNSDPVPFHYEDCPANWHDIAGQHFRVGQMDVHVGGNAYCGHANIVRGLCPFVQQGRTVHPAAALSADDVSIIEAYGIPLRETAPGEYVAASPIAFVSHYRIAKGRPILGQKWL